MGQITFSVSDIMWSFLEEEKERLGLLDKSETVRYIVGQYTITRRQEKFGSEVSALE